MGTASPAVRGNVGLVCKAKLGAAAAVEYDGDLKSYELEFDDKDEGDMTFSEASTGDGKEGKLKTKLLYSTKPGSFWRFINDNPNAEVVLTIGPHGNVVPTVDQPHEVFTVKTNGRPPRVQEARRGKDREVVDYEWGEITAGPVYQTT